MVVDAGGVLASHVRAARVLLVGAGGVGSEVVKSLALLPVAAVTVVDGAPLRRAQLARHALLRTSDVGANKAAALASGVTTRVCRGGTRVTGVAANVDEKFDSAHFDNVDVVVCAVDNVDARLYIDAQCVFRRLPLVDVSTLGARAAVVPVVPRVTDAGASMRAWLGVPAARDIAPCLLHHFPHAADHW
jgi:ubiquitin-activating enzyme E1